MTRDSEYFSGAQRSALIERLEAEERAFFSAKKVAANTAQGGSKVHNAVKAQDWFEAMALFLAEYRRSECEEFSRLSQAFHRIERMAEMLSAGIVPLPVEAATTLKGNCWSPGERRDVAAAVFYMDLAKSGDISDPSYNKTIRQHYDVQAQTVRRWWARRDEICSGLTTPPAALIGQQLAASGERYRRMRSGRGPARLGCGGTL